MLLVSRKNLFSERTRLAISVGGIALSVFLISVLLSLYRGWSERVGGFVEDSNVDVWIGTVGTIDFLGAASFIPLDDTSSIERFGGIDEWSPIIVRPMEGTAVQVNDDGERGDESRVQIHLIGYDPATKMSGPLKVIDGKETPGHGEVIIDKAVRTRYGVGPGDVLVAGGREWNIVGVSEGGDFVASQTAFVLLEDAQEALQMPNAATFLGLRLQRGWDPEFVAEKAEEDEPALVAFTGEEFAEATRERILGNLLPILTMVLALAFIVGLAVSGLTIYTSTIEKAREYGILKAVGFKNGYLYRLIFEQSLATAAIGFAIGIAGTLAFGPLAQRLVPQFVTLIRWQDTIYVFVVTVVMALIAGYVPVRRLAAIDPTSVFKA